MSHRTQDLEPRSGLSHYIRELRYHEVSRQSLAIFLILIYTLTQRQIPIAIIVASAVPIGIGTIWRLYASGFIAKNQELACNGPYALVRHPLYTGNILIVIGFSAGNGNWWAIPLALAFFWFYYPAAIEYEDRKLKRLFTEQWQTWAGRTPALIPAFGNIANIGGGRWSLAKSLKRNGEIFIAIYVLGCLAWILRQALALASSTL